MSPPAGHGWHHLHLHEGLHAPSLRHQGEDSVLQAGGFKVTLAHQPAVSSSCLQGTILSDCLQATFCRPCTWCQMSREMKRRSIQVVLVSSKQTWPPSSTCFICWHPDFNVDNHPVGLQLLEATELRHYSSNNNLGPPQQSLVFVGLSWFKYIISRDPVTLVFLSNCLTVISSVSLVDDMKEEDVWDAVQAGFYFIFCQRLFFYICTDDSSKGPLVFQWKWEGTNMNEKLTETKGTLSNVNSS